MPEQSINEQTRQMMGMPTSGDPAIIDPTTGRPYTADASMRQQEEITRQAEVKEEFNLLQDEKRADVRDEAKVSTLLETPETEDLAEEITEDLNQLKDPLSSIKPRARPKELEQKVGKLYQSAVKKAIELDYISKEEGGEEFDGYRGTKSNLRELDPQSLPTITKFITQALGVFDPNQDVTKAGVYWCAAFVNHILTEMGADTLGKGDRYRRLRAQEYINYGQEVSFDDMQEGDILLFGVPELGKVTHVGFYTGERDGEYVNMLGGNQRSEKSLGELVNIVPRSLKDIVGVRRVTYDGDAAKIIKDQKGDNSIFRYFDTDTYGASFIPSKSRKYNEGGDVAAQMDSMLPSADDDIRPEDYPQYKPDDFTGRSFAADSFQETKDRFMDAGKIDVDPNDPAIFTAYKRAVDYLKDTGLAGLGLADTAFKYAVGSVAQVMPTEQLEKRMARDLYSMPEAFAGAAGAKSITQLDDAADAFLEGSRQVAQKLKTEYDPSMVRIFAGETGLLQREKSQRRRSGQFSGEREVPKYSLPTAKTMKDSGKSDAEIEAATGLVYDDKTKMFRFEIDDQQATINYFPKNQSSIFSGELDEIAPDELDLGEFINHPELFNRYPQLKKYNVRIKNPSEMRGTNGSFGASTKTINLNADLFKSKKPENIEKLKSTLFHEIQHGVQYIENFEKDLISGVTGANTKAITKLAKDPYLQKLRDEISNSTLELDKLQSKLNGGTATPKDFDRLFELRDTIGFTYTTLKNQAYKKYLENLGEAEARTVGVRATSSKEKDLPLIDQRAEEAALTYFNPLTEQTKLENLIAETYITSYHFDEGKKYLAKTFGLENPKNVDRMFGQYYDEDLKLELISDGVRLGKDLLARKGELLFDSDLNSEAGIGDIGTGLPKVDMGEPKIISFTKKKEDKELENFNANLMSSISEQASKQAELVGELQEAGVYGDYQKGVRVQSQNYKGEALPPYTITGLSLNKVKLNNPNLKRTEDRLGIKFEYIEKDGDYYLPMLSVEQADGGKSQVYLDALKQRNTPIMDGPKDFNKGGAVMNEQMEMAFMQQGGLKDDGMKRDPVSGNEVPNGSMAKEVRDDIPAQLSEGEYVVPADVVRYLGVKHFEDLRNQAKSGLQSMEANGRIGGEPVPVGGPQAPTPYMAQGGDLTPDEMGEIMRMAQGGMIPSDPYQQQQAQYTQPVVQGLQVGGQPLPYNPYRPTGGFSWEQDSPQTTLPTTPQLPVIENEATCAARGLVYNPNTRMCESPQVAPTVTTTPVRGSEDGPSGSPPPTAPGTPGTPGSFDIGFKNWGAEVDWTDPESVEKFVTGQYNMPDPALRKGAGVVGLLGAGPLAAVGTVGSIFMAGQVLDTVADLRTSVMIAKAYRNTEGAAIAQAKLDAALKGAPSYVTSSFGDTVAPGTRQFAGHVSGASGLDDLPSDIDAWTENDFTRFQSAVGKKAPVKAEPTKTKKTALPPSTQPTMDTAPRRESRDSGPSGAEVARAAANRTAAASEVAKSEGVSAPTSGGARSVSAPKSETRGTGKKETYASKVQRGGGFNKGGLASRPKKK